MADVNIRHTELLMNSDQTLRLIIDEPLGGVLNMAVDEAILEAVGAGQSPPTLRFYRWEEPTISLGYFQKISEWKEQDEEIAHLALVRRKTGGGAILHDDELTYSLTLPLHQGLEMTDIQSMYKLVHDVCISTLRQSGFETEYRNRGDSCNSQRGDFFCFARAHCLDLVMDGKKLMGSAQRRTKNACLQHGSLIINCNFSQQPCSALESDGQTPFNLDPFVHDIARQIGLKLNLETQIGELDDVEKAKLGQLREKYGSAAWNNQS